MRSGTVIPLHVPPFPVFAWRLEGLSTPAVAATSPSLFLSAPHLQEPKKRFTYSQKYLSAMVEPQDSEEEEKNAKKRSRQAWLTANGFQLTGLHRSPESDCHLRLPPVGTVPELKEVHGAEWELRWSVRGDLPPYLLWCSLCRSGGKMPGLLPCWIESGGAGTGATRTSTCIGSPHLSWSCPLLQCRDLRQVTEASARWSLLMRAVRVSAAWRLGFFIFAKARKLSQNGEGINVLG